MVNVVKFFMMSMSNTNKYGSLTGDHRWPFHSDIFYSTGWEDTIQILCEWLWDYLHASWFTWLWSSGSFWKGLRDSLSAPGSFQSQGRDQMYQHNRRPCRSSDISLVQPWWQVGSPHILPDCHDNGMHANIDITSTTPVGFSMWCELKFSLWVLKDYFSIINRLGGIIKPMSGSSLVFIQSEYTTNSIFPCMNNLLCYTSLINFIHSLPSGYHTTFRHISCGLAMEWYYWAFNSDADSCSVWAQCGLLWKQISTIIIWVYLYTAYWNLQADNF